MVVKRLRRKLADAPQGDVFGLDRILGNTEEALKKLRGFADRFPKSGTELRMEEILDAECCVLELDPSGNPRRDDDAAVAKKPSVLKTSLSKASLTKMKTSMVSKSKSNLIGHFIPRMWPTNVVHYKVDDNFSETQKILIRRAVNEFHAKTNIRLIPRTFQKDFIFIKHVVGACYSKLGYMGGRQDICLSDKGVARKGTIMHEIMHALGFDHEHSRPDRDKFVFINWCNITEGFEPQFKTRYGFLSENGKYDYGSVMHYPAHAFADLKLLPTIIPNCPKTGPRGIGQRLWLSEEDARKINEAYRGGVTTGNTWDCLDSSGLAQSDEVCRFYPKPEKFKYQMPHKPLTKEVCEPDQSIRRRVATKEWRHSTKTKRRLISLRKKIEKMNKEKTRILNPKTPTPTGSKSNIRYRVKPTKSKVFSHEHLSR